MITPISSTQSYHTPAQVTSEGDHAVITPDWNARAPRAKTDLLIKRFIVVFIATCNFALLVVAAYLVVAYCPIPIEIAILTPFIAGILIALAHVKFPTCGIHSLNYKYYSNPISLIAQAITYLLFAPYLLAVNSFDWTPYHKPEVAHKIAQDLQEKSFAEVSTTYGAHFSNFARYGILFPRHAQALIELHTRYQPIEQKLAYLRKKFDGIDTMQARIRIAEHEQETLEQEFVNLINCQIAPTLNYPDVPDDTSWRTANNWIHRFTDWCDRQLHHNQGSDPNRIIHAAKDAAEDAAESE